MEATVFDPTTTLTLPGSVGRFQQAGLRRSGSAASRRLVVRAVVTGGIAGALTLMASACGGAGVGQAGPTGAAEAAAALPPSGSDPRPPTGQTTSAGQPAQAAQVGSGAPAAQPATQVVEGGQVTVAVTWPGTFGSGASAGGTAGVQPVFTVAMDTHSVNLDVIDLTRLAVLRTDEGREARPTEWNAPKGGHHRQGPLVFPAATGDAVPLLGADTHGLELTIRDVAGVPERRFRWTL